MPYPVPPPAPPPIVNVLSPEDQLHSSSPAVELGTEQVAPSAVNLTPTPTPAEVCAPERSASDCLSGNSERSISNGNPIDAGQVVQRADGLGSPLTTNVGPSVSTPLMMQGISPPQTVPEPASFSIHQSNTRVGNAPLGLDLTHVEEAVALPSQEQLTRLEPLRQQASAELTNLRLPILENLAQSLGSTPPVPPELLNDQPNPEGELFTIPGQDNELPNPDGEILTIPEQDNELPNPDGEILTIPEQDNELPNPDGEILTVPGQGDTPVPPSPDSQLPIPVPGEDPSPLVAPGDVVELSADEQEYDTERRIFFAEGNVVMRFQGGILAADRLRVNLPNRIAVAEGNVVLTRGEQVLRGDRFVYNFVQQQGNVLNARGEVFIPAAGRDLTPLPNDVSAGTITNAPITETITANQPAQGVSSPGGISITVGGGRRQNLDTQAASGELRRLRFEAEQIDFTADGWVARNVRLTNDPFSPPELEIRSRLVTFTQLSPTRSEIRARNPRLVFDQGFSLPLLRERIILDRQERDPGLIQFGFDQDDRGGLFIQRAFEPVATPNLRVTITPQILIQRAFDNGGDFADLGNYGLVSRLDAILGPQTSLRGTAVFTSLDPDDFEEDLRASVRVRQQVGTHQLSLEYSYRDRLFNGSLGFQTVQSSLGFVLTSPNIAVGDTGANFSYQVGAQRINASTDRSSLLEPDRTNDRVTLNRIQGSAALSRNFLLWAGTPLPATATEGLRFSPNPIVPYLIVVTGVRGVFSAYSNDETQATLTGTVGLLGQFGHFSRDFLDYTAFNIFYSATAQSGESPFRFDRSVDRQVLSFGIVQQIYGPFRFGIQTSINLDRSDEIDTDYILEYSRRTYAITVRYNPVREVGSIGLRISDFNWGTTPEPFSGFPETSTVEGGIQRSQD